MNSSKAWDLPGFPSCEDLPMRSLKNINKTSNSSKAWDLPGFPSCEDLSMRSLKNINKTSNNIPRKHGDRRENQLSKFLKQNGRQISKLENSSQKLFRNVLQQGSIPNHVAFILDGNRRYARKMNVDTIEGHKQGCKAFENTVKWAATCGIKTVTAFVFSIEKLQPLRDAGIRYQFLGDHSFFPKDLKLIMADVMKETLANTRIVVNIAFAYTGRNEITSGVGKLVKQLVNKEIDIDLVDESLLEQSLQVVPMPPVDLLVRTSECRLSDFLTWASSDRAVLCFVDVFWPDFSYWEFLLCVFPLSSFQCSYMGSVKDFH
ncbi:Dehydrodolichyl diphosphate syntase complex subunit SPAC4D7.04c [Orchesella cincta]|uniref:ditrans,polycis-polyprenyl diphosphate synthase [(2E,6E)-farnesyldiphosphate specific] n=1 Tax=Orchesella cincta TaxID=48709 RepID=A0A1D2M886_ORCCI|nr:Dehydrodolichyl diphosphate syntase complex subunit SPAC4D7.04c [Orchesella cincta]